MQWRKSSFSGGDSNCVELAWQGAKAAFRDSKHPDGGMLTISALALERVVAAAKQS